MEIVEEGLVPAHIAERERHWHRRHAALRIRREHGYSYRKVGECLKVSVERARGMCFRAERDENEGKLSPIELWISRQEADIPTIAKHIKRRANARHTPNAKTQRPPRPVPPTPDPYKEITKLKSKVRELERDLGVREVAIRGAQNEIQRLQRRYDDKRGEFDERYMELVMDHQDLKQYAMQLEEALGIRHKQPRPLSQKGNRMNIDTD